MSNKIVIIGLVAVLLLFATTTSAASDNGLDDGEPGDDMKKTNEFLKHVKKVIEYEGGYTNDPDDAGGETKYGIAKTYYPNVDIYNLTYEDAVNIYFNDYWVKNRIYNVPKHLRFIAFDSCVIPGPTFTRYELQKLAGVTQDGIIGPVTAKALMNVSADEFSAARWNYFLKKIRDRPVNEKFRAGWWKRCEKALAYQKSLY